MMYTLNSHNAACQLYLSKTGRKKKILWVLVLPTRNYFVSYKIIINKKIIIININYLYNPFNDGKTFSLYF